MLPRKMRPMRLSRRTEPFDSGQFIYELKIDGFRALARIEAGQGQLISATETCSVALPTSPPGSLNIFTFKALFSTARLLASMTKAAGLQ